MNKNIPSTTQSATSTVLKSALPRTIWIVGIVSFFSNSASVIITAFSAEFIINILGASPAAMGYIRGLSEALSYLVKMFFERSLCLQLCQIVRFLIMRFLFAGSTV